MTWFENDKRRLLWELHAVELYNRERLPDFKIAVSRSREALLLKTSIQPTVNLYKVRVSLGENYPRTMPSVTIEEPQLMPDTPHTLGSQRPCLFKDVGTQPWNWNPDLHTGVFALLAAWRWALAHDLYCTTGEWVVKDALAAPFDLESEDPFP